MAEIDQNLIKRTSVQPQVQERTSITPNRTIVAEVQELIKKHKETSPSPPRRDSHLPPSQRGSVEANSVEVHKKETVLETRVVETELPKHVYVDKVAVTLPNPPTHVDPVYLKVANYQSNRGLGIADKGDIIGPDVRAVIQNFDQSQVQLDSQLSRMQQQVDALLRKTGVGATQAILPLPRANYSPVVEHIVRVQKEAPGSYRTASTDYNGYGVGPIDLSGQQLRTKFTTSSYVKLDDFKSSPVENRTTQKDIVIELPAPGPGPGKRDVESIKRELQARYGSPEARRNISPGALAERRVVYHENRPELIASPQAVRTHIISSSPPPVPVERKVVYQDNKRDYFSSPQTLRTEKTITSSPPLPVERKVVYNESRSDYIPIQNIRANVVAPPPETLIERRVINQENRESRNSRNENPANLRSSNIVFQEFREVNHAFTGYNLSKLDQLVENIRKRSEAAGFDFPIGRDSRRQDRESFQNARTINARPSRNPQDRESVRNTVRQRRQQEFERESRASDTERQDRASYYDSVNSNRNQYEGPKNSKRMQNSKVLNSHVPLKLKGDKLDQKEPMLQDQSEGVSQISAIPDPTVKEKDKKELMDVRELIVQPLRYTETLANNRDNRNNQDNRNYRPERVSRDNARDNRGLSNINEEPETYTDRVEKGGQQRSRRTRGERPVSFSNKPLRDEESFSRYETPNKDFFQDLEDDQESEEEEENEFIPAPKKESRFTPNIPKAAKIIHLEEVRGGSNVVRKRGPKKVEREEKVQKYQKDDKYQKPSAKKRGSQQKEVFYEEPERDHNTKLRRPQSRQQFSAQKTPSRNSNLRSGSYRSPRGGVDRLFDRDSEIYDFEFDYE